MPDSQGQGFSGNPDPLKIPPNMRFEEEATLAGMLIGSVLYGVVTVLFSQCIAALFNPIHRRGKGIKWGLVSYTTVVFSAVTVFTAMNLSIQFISFVNNRGFAGGGPLGYRISIGSAVLRITPRLMFLLNNWLANGLVLYRCYIIYSVNLWAIVFPCLIYLCSLVTGVILIYQSSQLGGGIIHAAVDFTLLYLSISVSLNVLLTFTIIIWFVLHTKNDRVPMEAPAGIGVLCKAITTMFVESSALYAVSSLLVLVPWIARSSIVEVFLPVLAETQVMSSLLIIQRVAEKNALERGTSGYRASLIRRVRVETTVDFHRDKV